jgi:hypothetical protein
MPRWYFMPRIKAVKGRMTNSAIAKYLEKGVTEVIQLGAALERELLLTLAEERAGEDFFMIDKSMWVQRVGCQVQCS